MITRQMAITVCVPLLTSILAIGQTPAEHTTGKWKANVVSKTMRRPKQFSEIILDLHANGNQLEGTAQAKLMRGQATITEGKIDGDQVSFTTIFNESTSTSGIPELKFTGTIHGSEIKLVVDWHYSGFGADRTGDFILDMEGTRIAD